MVLTLTACFPCLPFWASPSNSLPKFTFQRSNQRACLKSIFLSHKVLVVFILLPMASVL